MADGPSPPIALAFAGVGASRPASDPAVLPAEAGEALRAFFDAHPEVAFAQFELAMSDDGDALEFAAGTLHDALGAPLRDGRESRRAGEALRRLLRDAPALADLPLRLAVAFEGIDHTFRIDREATGAAPIAGAADADERAAARERARLEAHDARWDQRDVLPEELDSRRPRRDDDHVA